MAEVTKATLKLIEVIALVQPDRQSSNGRPLRLTTLEKLATDSRVPLKVGFRATHILDQLQPHVKRYIDKRTPLIEQHGDPARDKDGKPTGKGMGISDKSPGWAAYLAEIEPLGDEPVEISFVPTPVSEFGALVNGGLVSAAELRAEPLRRFFVDDISGVSNDSSGAKA